MWFQSKGWRRLFLLTMVEVYDLDALLDAGGLARGSCSQLDVPSWGMARAMGWWLRALLQQEGGLNEDGAGSAPTTWGEVGWARGHVPAWRLSICPAPWAPGEAGLVQAALVSLQGAALKYLPSILEDVFGIFDSSALG